jgi:hypothetical protein
MRIGSDSETDDIFVDGGIGVSDPDMECRGVLFAEFFREADRFAILPKARMALPVFCNRLE